LLLRNARPTLHDIIVIGASSGGIDALRTILAGLPPDLPAAVFVVLHIGARLNRTTNLPAILERSGRLPAMHPQDGQEFRPGHVYVAPPDRHMLLEETRVRVVYGPKENLTRPAINPLFRSAAEVFGSRVIGVVLTGDLDDGVAGLAEIKRGGGLAVVQDPETATNPSMPRNAVHYVQVDRVAALQDIPAVLSELSTADKEVSSMSQPSPPRLVPTKCPECGGPLTEQDLGGVTQYQCKVGHKYSPLSLVEDQKRQIEGTLWRAVVELEESADIIERQTGALGL